MMGNRIEESRGRRHMVEPLETMDAALAALKKQIADFQQRQVAAQDATDSAKRASFKMLNAKEVEVNKCRIEFNARQAVEARLREDLAAAVAANDFSEALVIQGELQGAVSETEEARSLFRQAIKNFGNNESDDLQKKLNEAESELAALESGFIDDLLGRELPALREQYLAALAESWRILQGLAIKKRFFPRLADPLKYEIDDGAVLAAVRPYRFSLYRQ